MSRLILYILILVPVNLFSQSTFERELSLPNDTLASSIYIKDMVVTQYGTIKVLGRFYDGLSPATSGNFIADLSLNGDISNIVYYPFMDPGNTLIESQNGAFIIAGDDIDIGFMTRVDDQGHIIWQKHYENDDEVEMYETVETSTGDLISTGEIDDWGDYHLFIKTDMNGDTLWTKMYLDGGEGYAIALLPDDGSVSTGDAFLYPASFGNGDIPVTRLDKDGNILWMKIYGDSANQYGNSILYTSQQSILVGGATGHLPADTLHTDQNAFIMNLDLQGNILWYLELDDNGGNEHVQKLIEDCTGDYIAAIYHHNQADSSNYAILVDISPDGQIEWSKRYGQQDNPVQYIADLIETPDDGFLLSCQTYQNINQSGISIKTFIIKTDASGNSHCSDADLILQEQTRNLLSMDDNTQGWFPMSAYDATFKDGRDTIFGLKYTTYCSTQSFFTTDSLFLYPNPAPQGFFNLYKRGCPDESFSITVFDAIGRQVYTHQANAGEAINKAYNLKLARGVYILKFEQNNKKTIKKFVVE